MLVSKVRLIVFLSSLSVTSVASVASVPPSQSSWVDVCGYQDPTGNTCCAPDMEGHTYLVIPELHDWTEHSLQCR